MKLFIISTFVLLLSVSAFAQTRQIQGTKYTISLKTEETGDQPGTAEGTTTLYGYITVTAIGAKQPATVVRLISNTYSVAVMTGDAKEAYSIMLELAKDPKIDLLTRSTFENVATKIKERIIL